MSESTALAEQQDGYRKVIKAIEPDFKKLAPASMRFEAESGYAYQLLQNNDYLMKVAEQNPISLAQAIKNVAAIGLSLNPAKKQAYLIPRNIKAGGKWISKVFLEPSYMGMCDLATSSGAIQWVQSQCVYAADEFIDNGPGEKPTHKYNAFSTDRGEFVGVYCVAKTREGDYLTTIMPKAEVESVRARSESYKAFVEKNQGNGGPWVTDFNEQAKKTVVRRAFKMWPKGEHMERLEEAVHLSNENEGFEPLVTAPELNQYTASQKEHFDYLITNADAIGMHCFMSSLDHGVQTALYNSFEKGSIGKYKTLVTKLQQEGYSLLTDIEQVIKDATESGDDLAAKEVLEDLRQEAIDFLFQKLEPENRAFMRECLDQQ